MTKLIASLTTCAFLFSFVFAEPVQAVLESARSSVSLQKSLDTGIIPASAGRITSWRSFGGQTVVVNIQDLHCHGEVQRNISRILAALDERYGLKQVFIEGAAGKLDTSWLGGIKDKKLRTRLMESLIDDGRLTGTEYYSITADRPGLLRGLEDEPVYRDNLVRFSRILGRRAFFGHVTLQLRDELERMKKAYFRRSNRRLEQLAREYRDGRVTTEKYYALLRKFADKINARPGYVRGAANLDLAEFPNFMSYTSLKEEGRHISYSKVRTELGSLLAVLREKLPYQAYRLLLKKTDDFRRSDELYGCLAGLAREFGLDLTVNYPELARFLAYSERSSAVNPVELIREEKRLLDDLRVALAEDDGEREIAFLSGFYGYVEDYFYTRLAADDYQYFKARFPKFRQLWAKHASRDVLSSLSHDLSVLETYHAVNIRRNACFLEAAAADGAAMESQDVSDTAASPDDLLKGRKLVVMVTGGFHTHGLQQLLADRRISYLSITPQVTKDTESSERVYLELARAQASIFAQSLAQESMAALVATLSRTRLSETVLVRKLLDEIYGQLLNALAREGMLGPESLGVLEGLPLKAEGETKTCVKSARLEPAEKGTGKIIVELYRGKPLAYHYDTQSRTVISQETAPQSQVSKGVIPGIQRFVRSRLKVSQRVYEDAVAPLIEEGFFTGIVSAAALLAAASMPAFLAALFAARIVFVALHAGSRDLSDPWAPRTLLEKLLIPMAVSVAVIVVSAFAGPVVAPIAAILLHAAANAAVPGINRFLNDRGIDLRLGKAVFDDNGITYSVVDDSFQANYEHNTYVFKPSTNEYYVITENSTLPLFPEQRDRIFRIIEERLNSGAYQDIAPLLRKSMADIARMSDDDFMTGFSFIRNKDLFDFWYWGKRYTLDFRRNTFMLLDQMTGRLAPMQPKDFERLVKVLQDKMESGQSSDGFAECNELLLKISQKDETASPMIRKGDKRSFISLMGGLDPNSTIIEKLLSPGTETSAKEKFDPYIAPGSALIKRIISWEKIKPGARLNIVFKKFSGSISGSYAGGFDNGSRIVVIRADDGILRFIPLESVSFIHELSEDGKSSTCYSDPMGEAEPVSEISFPDEYTFSDILEKVRDAGKLPEERMAAIIEAAYKRIALSPDPAITEQIITAIMDIIVPLNDSVKPNELELFFLFLCLKERLADEYGSPRIIELASAGWKYFINGPVLPLNNPALSFITDFLITILDYRQIAEDTAAVFIKKTDPSQPESFGYYYFFLNKLFGNIPGVVFQSETILSLLDPVFLTRLNGSERSLLLLTLLGHVPASRISGVFIRQIDSFPAFVQLVISGIYNEDIPQDSIFPVLAHIINQNMIDNESTAVRQRFYKILGLISSKGVKSYLLRSFQRETDIDIRKTLALSLSQRYDYFVIPMLNDMYPGLRDEIKELTELVPLLRTIDVERFNRYERIDPNDFAESIFILPENIITLLENLRFLKKQLSDREFREAVMFKDLRSVNPVILLNERATGTREGEYMLPLPVKAQEVSSQRLAKISGSSHDAQAIDELRELFNGYREKLIASNFAALGIFKERTASMTKADGEQVFKHVKRMIDCIDSLDAKQGEVFRKVYDQLYNDFSIACSHEDKNGEGDNFRLPGYVQWRLTELQQWHSFSYENIRTVHTLINAIHTVGTSLIQETLKRKGANLIMSVDDHKLQITNLSHSDLFRNGRMANRALTLFLKAFLNGSGHYFSEMATTVSDSYIFWSCRIGAHRIELMANIDDPDNGGFLRILYCEGGNDSGNIARMRFLQNVFNGLGMHIKDKDTTVNAAMIEAVLDKDHGATNTRQIESALFFSIIAALSSSNLDWAFQSIEAIIAAPHIPDPLSAFNNKDMDDVVDQLVAIYLAEGRIPFFVHVGFEQDTRFAQGYCDYLRLESKRNNLRGELNAILAELGLPPIPETEQFGQQVIERYFTSAIHEALARGELILDNKGFPQKNAAYAPLADLTDAIAQAIAADDEQIFLSARLLGALPRGTMNYRTMGFVGGYTAMIGVRELEAGEWLVVQELRDPSSGDIVMARPVIKDIVSGDSGSLSSGELAFILRNEGYPVPNNDPISLDPALKSGAVDMLYQPLPVKKPGMKTIYGTRMSQGDGRMVFGRVTFEHEYWDKRGPDSGLPRVFIAPYTQPDNLGDIQYAAAVVTTGGGELSHAGITTREKGIPSLAIHDARWERRPGTLTLKVHPLEQKNVRRDEHGFWVADAIAGKEVSVNEGDIIAIDPASGSLLPFVPESREVLRNLDQKLYEAMRSGEYSAALKSWMAATDTMSRGQLADTTSYLFYYLFTVLQSPNDLMRGTALRMLADLQNAQAQLPIVARERLIECRAAVQKEMRASWESELQVMALRSAAGNSIALKLAFDLYKELTRKLEAYRLISNAIGAPVDWLKEAERALAGFKDLSEALERARQDENVKRLARLVESDRERVVVDIRPIYTLSELDRNTPGVGGKAANLGELMEALRNAGDESVRIPDGFVVSTLAFDRFLDETGIRDRFRELLGELDAVIDLEKKGPERPPELVKVMVESISQEIRALIDSADWKRTKLGDDILQMTEEGKFYAVRSSAVQEDMDNAASAGIAESFLYVTDKDVLETIKKVWMSFWLYRGIKYRAGIGIKQQDVEPAVLVQMMVDSSVSGVIFTVDPVTGEEHLLFNAARGVGAVVAGDNVDKYIVNKEDGKKVRRGDLKKFPVRGTQRTKFVFNKEAGTGVEEVFVDDEEMARPCLTSNQLRKLAHKAVDFEEYFGYPVDIEWGIDEKGIINILQVRPITALGAPASIKMQESGTEDEFAASFWNELTRWAWILELPYFILGPVVYNSIVRFIAPDHAARLNPLSTSRKALDHTVTGILAATLGAVMFIGNPVLIPLAFMVSFAWAFVRGSSFANTHPGRTEKEYQRLTTVGAALSLALVLPAFIIATGGMAALDGNLVLAVCGMVGHLAGHKLYNDSAALKTLNTRSTYIVSEDAPVAEIISNAVRTPNAIIVTRHGARADGSAAKFIENITVEGAPAAVYAERSFGVMILSIDCGNAAFSSSIRPLMDAISGSEDFRESMKKNSGIEIDQHHLIPAAVLIDNINERGDETIQTAQPATDDRLREEVIQLAGKQLTVNDLPKISSLLRDAPQDREASGVKKIIFVCTGNTCRSPMAEYFMRAMLKEEGIQGIDVLSRGTSVWRPEPIANNSATVLSRYGISSDSHMAKNLSDQDMGEGVLVIGLTSGHAHSILDDHSSLKGRVFRLKDFATRSDRGGDVADPYGGSLSVYEDTAEEIRGSLQGMLERLKYARAYEALVEKETELKVIEGRSTEKTGSSLFSPIEAGDGIFCGVIRGRPFFESLRGTRHEYESVAMDWSSQYALESLERRCVMRAAGSVARPLEYLIRTELADPRFEDRITDAVDIGQRIHLRYTGTGKEALRKLESVKVIREEDGSRCVTRVVPEISGIEDARFWNAVRSEAVRVDGLIVPFARARDLSPDELEELSSMNRPELPVTVMAADEAEAEAMNTSLKGSGLNLGTTYEKKMSGSYAIVEVRELSDDIDDMRATLSEAKNIASVISVPSPVTKNCLDTLKGVFAGIASKRDPYTDMLRTGMNLPQEHVPSFADHENLLKTLAAVLPQNKDAKIDEDSFFDGLKASGILNSQFSLIAEELNNLLLASMHTDDPAQDQEKLRAAAGFIAGVVAASLEQHARTVWNEQPFQHNEDRMRAAEAMLRAYRNPLQAKKGLTVIERYALAREAILLGHRETAKRHILELNRLRATDPWAGACVLVTAGRYLETGDDRDIADALKAAEDDSAGFEGLIPQTTDQYVVKAEALAIIQNMKGREAEQALSNALSHGYPSALILSLDIENLKKADREVKTVGERLAPSTDAILDLLSAA